MITHEFTPFAHTVHRLLLEATPAPHYIGLYKPESCYPPGVGAMVIDGPTVVTVAVNLDGHRSWLEAMRFANHLYAVLERHGLKTSNLDLVMNVYGEKSDA